MEKRYNCDVDASTEATRRFTRRTHFICLGCEQMTRVELGGNNDCCWGVFWKRETGYTVRERGEDIFSSKLKHLGVTQTCCLYPCDASCPSNVIHLLEPHTSFTLGDIFTLVHTQTSHLKITNAPSTIK